jgi:LysR family transcriptional regulator, benzoate and cis,cis-muconate-responsive activator of ben and cat genes
MDFRHLKYFVAVAQERSFTRAAERLYISQPPLSRQIQQLEEELGLLLFDREARPLALTEAGRFFYGRAVRMLEQLDESIAMTRRLSQVERRLVIGFVPSTMYGALPRIARLFRSRKPQTPLVLVEKTSVEQVEALKAGQIDVGFGRIRFDDPTLKREVLREERLVLAIPGEHPLAAESGPVSLAQAAAHPLLVYPRKPRPSYADHVLSLFRDLGLEPAEVHEIQEMQTALGLVASGMGLCVVPESAQKLRREEVVYRTLVEPSATSAIIMSTRLNDQSEDIVLLRELIDEVYRLQAAEKIEAERKAAASVPSALTGPRRS